MSRPRLVVHGHFYQPSRLDPFTGTVPPDPTAAPARDWNSRIAADCYRPNAELGNYGRMSWDLGPDARGLARGRRPGRLSRLRRGRRRASRAWPSRSITRSCRSRPLADRRTEIRWGLRDFEWRFGRRPTGIWLPETAVDLETLRLLVDEGVTHTILAPWQLAGRGARHAAAVPGRPRRRPVDRRARLRRGAVDGGLVRDRGRPPTRTGSRASGSCRGSPSRWMTTMTARAVRVIATDGELYGHHQPFREQFLERLVGPTDLGFEVATLARRGRRGRPRALARRAIVERTSWSCHHGVARWETACGCVADGAWKAPLRAALDRLAGGDRHAGPTRSPGPCPARRIPGRRATPTSTS